MEPSPGDELIQYMNDPLLADASDYPIRHEAHCLGRYKLSRLGFGDHLGDVVVLLDGVEIVPRLGELWPDWKNLQGLHEHVDGGSAPEGVLELPLGDLPPDLGHAVKGGCLADGIQVHSSLL